MDIILYSPDDPIFQPPHVYVEELRKKGDRWTIEAQDKHQACMRGELKHEIKYPNTDYQQKCSADANCTIHRIYPCARCDWAKPALAKLRVEKRRKVREFQRTGKLPPFAPSWSWPKRMPAVEFRLPTIPAGTGKLVLSAADKVTGDVVARYLEDRGEDTTKNCDGTWTCGCKILRDTSEGVLGDPRVNACKKHERALEGWDLL